MALASGTAEYTFETPRVLGHGHSLSNDELEAALSETAKIVFDDEGNARVKDLLTDLAGTEFKKDNLNAILEGSSPENWRVGEALAEAYLVQHHDCTFPWPDGRDERKSGSCLPGADLAGFQKESGIDRFAFGEVKTSSEAAYPPGVMHGRHGLKKQSRT